jgi:hypothetical protein
MAGFQVIIYGRFWVFTEDGSRAMGFFLQETRSGDLAGSPEHQKKEY